MTTALELVQSAAVEMGLQAPTSVYSTAELIPQQLGALLNLTGEMLVKRKVWRRLFREVLLPTVSGQGVYPLPADFARPISQTEWDTINRWPMIGPETVQQWQWLKSGLISTGPRGQFRLVGNNIEVWPVPGTPGEISYCYISKYWAIATDGVTMKPKCTVDNDTTIFDDRLMISGLKLRFYQAKQFDTNAYASEFQTNMDDAIAQDAGAPILSLSRRPAFPLITVDNLPDTGYGL
jgi:hypothetical protein